MYRENESADTAETNDKDRDAEWFKQRLIEQSVSALEIIWGNYLQYFHEVPPHLMDRYLHHRSTFLHRQALALARLEEAAMEDHPFAT